jgi:hypothetical protein
MGEVSKHCPQVSGTRPAVAIGEDHRILSVVHDLLAHPRMRVG